MRRGETHFVFDVDLAKSQTDENPVFYVQMALRAWSASSASRAGSGRRAGGGTDLSVLTQPEEADLIKELWPTSRDGAGAAAAREPPRITGYLEGLARLAHAWYHK